MTRPDLREWLAAMARPDRLWYAKRLAGNDTGANGTHQSGTYLPRDLARHLFPSLNRPDAENPRVGFDAIVESHGFEHRVKAIWYNNLLREGTRNETRITNWGGTASPLQDPENTGALAIFAFRPVKGEDCPECSIWVCRGLSDEERAEDWIGPVDPGRPVVWRPEQGVVGQSAAASPCWLQPDEILPRWHDDFPNTKELALMAVERCKRLAREGPDKLLVRRTDCEYDIFQSIEEAVAFPRIEAGFDSFADFVDHAQPVFQRRKSRSGRSLELHVRQILREEGLQQGRDFDHGAVSESGKKPDFLFPSQACYLDDAFPRERLRMLAVKRSCKDRWRQVIDEAEKIPTKHLLTLQPGVSPNQYRQMRDADIRLVVPPSLHTKFPPEARPELLTFQDFLDEVKGLASGADA